ncbi:uncharacterized protein LOC133795593 [Humulus lupulus]|uniref:uncharacterized protein LOC133795593 n=1 Tax=Humulus lupulus TaxID=3486 RepID=UPI002B409A3B|nr:uncharacterized protein LOC133795593 [Humulus lupulus]
MSTAAWNTARELRIKLKELSLNLEPEKGKHSKYYYYWLPKSVVNLRDLTILELSGLELGYSFSFPSLKSLSLKDVGLAYNVKNDVLSKSLLDCPSLEKLFLSSCYKFSSHHPLRLQSSSLKLMEIKSNVSLQVEAINLEYLVLDLVCFGEINISACKAIRNLSLINCEWGKTDQSSFEDLVSNLPHLENLTLDTKYYKSGLERLKISSQHLKSFKFSNGNYMIKDVTIKSTPKLTSFCYEGNMNCNISLESPNLLNGKIVIKDYPPNYDTNWFINMINFFLNLNCSWNIVTLHVFSDEALIMPDNCKRICHSPLLNWKHVRVITRTRYTVRKSDLRYVLMWISPSLKTLSINGEDIF